ncbi:hypothetical protein CFOLD11_40340 [Clostridium folliculivorans]|uniref:Uncharacterized protein n=1 Tax=Clostridium folliculivorans TaxID=2886038 RepID=A0A9W5Y6A6_9CLOT|nr:hypothetical protein [Clostridium folliculivorans]GKU27207.1 hypothetical protein CFOLD11_40340 [Clostridium folliculivorans]
MRRYKKIYIIIILAFFMTAAMSTGTYAFLTDRNSNEKNTITTGEYPKPFIRIYASIGPLYSGYFKKLKIDESPSYNTWLDNACTYILRDLDGKAPGEAIGTGYAQFKNIPSDNKSIGSKSDISSPEFKNWDGGKLNCNGGEEYGTLVHNIIAIGTPISNGLNYGKIKLNDATIEITQRDVFQSTSKKDANNKYNEYTLANESTNLSIDKNRNRVVTYDYKEGKYERTGTTANNKYTPADQADLIIFDAGNNGYSTSDLLGGNANQFDKLEALLNGKMPYAYKKGNAWSTDWIGKMNDIVLKYMSPKGDINCKLDRTEFTATFKYNDYQVPIQKYIINY